MLMSIAEKDSCRMSRKIHGIRELISILYNDMPEDAEKKQALLDELSALLSDGSEVATKFRARIEEGRLTRDDDPATHFCAYFVAIDRQAKQVFLIHHKKSGLWLFSGGHLEKGETFRMAAEREISEEWGLRAEDFQINDPALLTITPIENPNKPCRFHFEAWFFLEVEKDNFRPDPEKIAQEAYDWRWVPLAEARHLSRDEMTLRGHDFIEKNYFFG